MCESEKNSVEPFGDKGLKIKETPFFEFVNNKPFNSFSEASRHLKFSSKTLLKYMDTFGIYKNCLIFFINVLKDLRGNLITLYPDLLSNIQQIAIEKVKENKYPLTIFHSFFYL